MSVSSELMKAMAMIVESTVERFETIVVAVLMTTPCTPPTSLVRRDWISPVRVAVKKRSGMCCRYQYIPPLD